MELKLNVYTDEKLKELEKTYTCNDFALSTGVVEDLLDLINIDLFTGKLSQEEVLVEIAKIVIKGKPAFNNIVKNIFDGLSDDEIRRTNLREFVKVLYDTVVYTIAGLMEVSPEKN